MAVHLLENVVDKVPHGSKLSRLWQAETPSVRFDLKPTYVTYAGRLRPEARPVSGLGLVVLQGTAPQHCDSLDAASPSRPVNSPCNISPISVVQAWLSVEPAPTFYGIPEADSPLILPVAEDAFCAVLRKQRINFLSYPTQGLNHSRLPCVRAGKPLPK